MRLSTGLIELNNQKEKGLSDKLLWGALFGKFFFSSQVLPYFFLSFGNNITEQFNVINFVPNKILSPTRGILLSLATYSAASMVFFSFANIAYKQYKGSQKPTRGMDKKKADELEISNDINHLFSLTVNQRKLKFSIDQKIGAIIAIAAFSVLNGYYCSTFQDVTGEALKLLPTYGGIYSPLNQYAGYISYFSNFLLNEWFAFTALRDIISGYNGITRITRPHFHKEGSASKPYIGFTSTVTGIFSVFSSVGFFFLTLDDPHIKCDDPSVTCYAPYKAKLILISAVVVYGLVLNLVGSKGIVNRMMDAFDWLKDIPNSIKQTLASLWKYANPKENLRELKYLLGFNSNYESKNKLALPLVVGSSLPVLATGITQQPMYSKAELKAAVDQRIRTLPEGATLNDKTLRRLIIEERNRLDTERNSPTTKRQMWKHGLIRHNTHTLVSMIGPFGISVILWGYYFLVEGAIAPLIGLQTGNAAARQLSLYSFFPFAFLMLSAGHDSMSNLFNKTEVLITDIKDGQFLPKT